MKNNLLILLSVLLSFFISSFSMAGSLSDKKAKKALQSYLDQNPAVIRVSVKFPASLKMGDYKLKQLEPLVSAGILSKKDIELKARGFAAASGQSKVPGIEFSLTELGKKLVVSEDKGSGGFGKSTRIKYGDLMVGELISKSDPIKQRDHTVSRVEYTSKLKKPVFEIVESKEVIDRYKFIKEQLEGKKMNKAVLVKASKGWVHEKMLNQ